MNDRDGALEVLDNMPADEYGMFTLYCERQYGVGATALAEDYPIEMLDAYYDFDGCGHQPGAPNSEELNPGRFHASMLAYMLDDAHEAMSKLQDVHQSAELDAIEAKLCSLIAEAHKLAISLGAKEHDLP